MGRSRKKDEPTLLGQATLDRLALDFETSFFEQVVDQEPDHLEALLVLGQAYTNSGHYDKGLRIDQRLSALLPDDPTVHYNLSCSYCLAGQVDLALDTLERAIELGYKDLRHLLKDPDLQALRRDERFRGIVARLKRKDRRTV